MVTLQSVISDTKVQLDEIIEACDRLLGENTISSLVRLITSDNICMLIHNSNSSEKYLRNKKSFA
jgi:hypothetical protein